MAGLTEAALDPVLTGQPDLVEAALRMIYPDAGAPRDLVALRAAAGMLGIPLARMLLLLLRDDQTDGAFVSILLRQGVDLLDQPGPHAPGWDEDALAAFLRASRAFRCRILVGGKICGSGVLITPRLVLTAQHVLEGRGAGARIEVLASDGHLHAAQVILEVPYDPADPQGLPPQPVPAAAGSGAGNADVALLRLDHPLGHRYGRAALPEAAVPVRQVTRMILIHYPEGQARGVEFGEVHPGQGCSLRLRHDAPSAPGSSGGACFDNQLRFLGLHQGKWIGAGSRKGRLVPHDQFAALPDFRERLSADRTPRHLWSLDGTLDSHIIIGRALFFDTVCAIVEGEVALLRGLWIRRGRALAGLGFSFQMLEAWLAALEAPDRCLRVAPSLASDDLIALVQEARGGGPAPGAHAGVRAGETTRLATDADRARAIADALEAEARADGRPVWIYLDDPPAELDQPVQFQLEHLVHQILTRPSLRLVLAGYDSYGLDAPMVQSVADARASRVACVMREIIEDFRSEDVAQTIAAISDSLGMGFAPDVVTHIAGRVLEGLPQHGGFYAPALLAEVALRIRTRVTAEAGR
ncbi:MAG: trypsin-like serine peptidase [Paracoccus sp. (in: a-proteobacteria)]|uniref:trypsin-like serine peptidase n=1 Tax=Paracoccus sp. TaxID=267 RepID=UPI00391D63B5